LVVAQLSTGQNETLMDLDVFSLTGCSGGEVGSEVVTACIPQQMLQVNASIPAAAAVSAGWESLTVQVYARDATNENYYNSKLVTIWGLSLVLDGVEWCEHDYWSLDFTAFQS
jgi:hypothetical protein